MTQKARPASADVSRDLENDTVDRKPTPLPKLQLAVLLYLQLAEPVTGLVIFPFIVQLISETGITGGDVTKVGYYAGLVESLFFVTEALMIFHWGRLSDRIGRRPILLTGLFGLWLSMFCFGLSHTFWAVVVSRAISGALNGNTGVIKSMMSEMSDETNIAQAFAFVPIVWAVGSTLAPLLGGLLQHPYERFGGIFRHSVFWKNNPYFLPCIVAAIFPATAFVISYFLLKETAPAVVDPQSKTRRGSHSSDRNVATSSASTTPTERSPLLSKSEPSPTSLRSLLTRRVIIVILNYSIFAINDIAFFVLQPLFLSTPIARGGLGMQPSTIGICLAVLGIANGTASMLFFAWLNKRLGTRRLLTCCALSFLGTFSLYPIINAIARAQGGRTIFVWIAFGVQISLATLSPMGFSCILLYITSASPRAALGATNGLAQTTTSIMRAIGPTVATSLFAVTMDRNLMGGLLVYFVLCLSGLVAVTVTRMLPKKPWPRPEA